MKPSSGLVIHLVRSLLFFAFLLSPFLIMAKEFNADVEIKLLTSPVTFFSMLDEPNKLDGYSIDLNKAILTNAGYRVSVESLPWARVLKQSENHPQNVISAILRTPEREDLFLWITPISVSHIGMYTLETPHEDMNSIEKISTLGNIAVLRGDYRHQILNSQNITRVMTFNHWSVAIQSLLRGRTKSLFFSDMGLILTCIDAKLDCSSIKRAFTYKKSVSYLAIRKRDESLPIYEALKKSAEEFKASLAFQELVSRYLNSEHPAAKSLQVDNGILHIKAN